LARELVFSQKIIFLKKPIKKLMEHIKNRGRSYEQKITSDYLEKIEAGDYEQLPFDVYVKGFLRSYAKYLDLDTQKVVAQFEKEVGIRNNVKKYQQNEGRSWESSLPSLTITPKIASLVFSAVVVLVGITYFYLEVENIKEHRHRAIYT